jgi:uncharacterized protein HemY
MMEMAHALEHLGEVEEASRLGSYTLHRHPHHAEARLAQARAEINIQEWDRAHDLLASIDTRKVDEGTAQHVHHLLGHALLGRGQTEEARRVLEKGAAIAGGRCDLSLLLAVVTPLPASLGAPEAETWNADQTAVRSLLAAIRDADARLAQGDATGARHALDRLVVTESREVQSLGRAAEAWLRDGPTEGPLRFEKARGLASFRAAHAQRAVVFRHELLLPQAHWDTARLDEVAGRAAAWLDATFAEAPAQAGV